MIRWRRTSPTGVLTGAVLVLLPLLGILQYHWLSQIGEETGSRMRAVATSAAEALSADLAFEVGRAWRERIEAGAERGNSPPLVLDALVVDEIDDESAPPRVRRWDLDSRTCEPAEWPARYGPIPHEGHGLAEQLRHHSASLGIVPIDLSVWGHAGRPVRPACEVSDGGVVLFRLDPIVLRRTLVLEVVRRHVDALEDDGFDVAIVSSAKAPEVIYASPGADAAAVAARPDVVTPLRLADPDGQRRSGRRGGGRDGRPTVPVEGRGRPYAGAFRGEAGDGWLFVAQHRAGSLENAVTRLRARNLVLSLGVLSLLGVAVWLIAANARRAERLGRQQVEFVAAVSHEMRTPVTGIELAARNLEDGLVGDPARVQRYGAVIRGEARRLAETVERVLQFAALEAGRGVGHVAEVDVRAVVEDVVVRARSEHPEATIELEVGGRADVVRGDAGALRSAVQNLLANALKYGGTPPWASVRVARAGDVVPAELSVTVEDRGPGIDPRDVPHVFEPFYRGQLATERRAPGNGLGLHIVKRSIEALGGRVTLRTAAGSGTAVGLHLPLASTKEAQDGEPRTPAGGRG